MRLVLCRVGAILTFTIQMQACTEWSIAPLSPREVIVQERPETVRATLHDGRRLVVARPSIAGDSILGVVEECRPSDSQFGSPSCHTMVRPMLWLDDLQVLEVRQSAPQMSALAAIVAVVGFLSLRMWIPR